MLTPTHLIAAQTAYFSGYLVVLQVPRAAEAVVAACASLIADLDSRQSYVGRLFPFVSGPLE